MFDICSLLLVVCTGCLSFLFGMALQTVTLHINIFLVLWLPTYICCTVSKCEVLFAFERWHVLVAAVLLSYILFCCAWAVSFGTWFGSYVGLSGFA